MATVFEDLLTNVETMISAIVAGEGADAGSDGYNFTWPAANVNAYDASQRVPGPWADVFYESDQPSEAQGNTAGMYDGMMRLKIVCGYTYDMAQEKPKHQGQIDTSKAFDDLRRLFGRDARAAAGSSTGARFIDIDGRTNTLEYMSNDHLNPVAMNTYWVAPYSVDRGNPDLRGQ